MQALKQYALKTGTFLVVILLLILAAFSLDLMCFPLYTVKLGGVALLTTTGIAGYKFTKWRKHVRI